MFNATVTLARNAMATRFELVLHGSDPISLRAAGEEALDEIERLEAQLSLFRPSSEIAHLNALAAREPVKVSPMLFALLQHAAQLTVETKGAFDISIAPLMRCWGFLAGNGRQPPAPEVHQVRQSVGMHLVELDASNYTVRFKRAGVMLDLGAIGKGYAIERAVDLLREAGVSSGFLHGGTSTAFALGSPPEGGFWRVELALPTSSPKPELLSSVPQGSSGRFPLLTSTGAMSEGGSGITIELKDEALSVSAVWGRFFENAGERVGHVVDPRSGYPAKAASLAAVIVPSATESDAFSTALLTLGPEAAGEIASLRPGGKAIAGNGWGADFKAHCVNITGPK